MVYVLSIIVSGTSDTKDNNGTLHLIVLDLYQIFTFTSKTTATKVANGLRGPTTANVPEAAAAESRFKPEDV